ncbi:helix-turn-helix domain-containing protein [Moorena producens]|uniref:helix-turn-helix domain-containing protein n=1 Tax=Moorena producens TaxID=1155739 RepID=UPI003C762E71
MFLNPEQRAIVRHWFGVSRYVFNKTVKILENGEVKANWKAMKTGIINDLPEWCKTVPYQIKSIAIKDACPAVRVRSYRKDRVAFIVGRLKDETLE